MSKSHIIIDLTKDNCPIPLIKTKLALKSLVTGQVLTIKLRDAGSVSDIPKWLNKMGFKSTIETLPQHIEIEIIK